MKTPTVSGLHPLLRAFPGAVLELSPEGTVLASNGRLERALEREVVGETLARLLDGGSLRKWERLLAHVPEEEPAAWELVLEGRGGCTVRAFHLARERGEAGERLWLVESPRDPRAERAQEEISAVNSELATTQRELAREKARLERALEELERELRANEKLSQALQAAFSARNRFYASMNHELRTPVNAVMGYNDLLLAGVYGALSEQQELAVERSQKAARHLRELVDDVLDISRLEAGRIDLQPERVELGELVRELLASVRPLADGRGSVLHLSQEGGPHAVVTDPRRVRQILLNLLSNAIKFGNGAPIRIHCRHTPDGGVAVEVVDGGGGIPPEEMGRVFEEFVQLGSEVVGGDPAGGAGLGLPISRRLAHLLGGRLEASSTVGVGSTFRLSLPPSVAAS